MRYDISVIGNDEAAFEMLCLAAESGKHTAAVLPESRHSSWLIGMAFKRLIADLLVNRSMSRRRHFTRISSPRLLGRLLAKAIVEETNDLICTLERLNIHICMGQPRFNTRHCVSIIDGRTNSRSTLNACHFIIGTGTRFTVMYRPAGQVTLHRPEAIFGRNTLPQSICVLGGDSLGCGVAALFSLFGVRSSYVADNQQDSAMLELAKAAGVEIVCHPSEYRLAQFTEIPLDSHTDVVDCRRTIGFTDFLNLSAIGVETDENGQLWCSSGLETWCPGVFGIGQVVGFSPDSAVGPSIQAERIMHRISRHIPDPHFTSEKNPKSHEYWSTSDVVDH